MATAVQRTSGLGDPYNSARSSEWLRCSQPNARCRQFAHAPSCSEHRGSQVQISVPRMASFSHVAEVVLDERHERAERELLVDVGVEADRQSLGDQVLGHGVLAEASQLAEVADQRVRDRVAEVARGNGRRRLGGHLMQDVQASIARVGRRRGEETVVV